MINGMRKEDNSTWGIIDHFLERFGRLLIAVTLAASTWFMSHIVTPLKEIPNLVEKQQTTDSLFRTVNIKLDNAAIARNRLEDILATLTALQCEQFTPREKLTSNLCRKFTAEE